MLVPLSGAVEFVTVVCRPTKRKDDICAIEAVSLVVCWPLVMGWLARSVAKLGCGLVVTRASAHNAGISESASVPLVMAFKVFELQCLQRRRPDALVQRRLCSSVVASAT